MDWQNTQQTAAQVIYNWRKEDTNGELTEPCTLDAIIHDEIEDGAELDNDAIFDALAVENKRLERTAILVGKSLNRTSSTLKIVENGIHISKPMRKNGVTNIAIIYELTDGQTVSVLFHNPDTTPNKLKPDDMMIAWRWLLNRKDITIVVAKEKGRDLPIQQIANRVMALADKNTARFAKANAKKGEETQLIKALEEENARLEERLEYLNKLAEEKENSANPENIDEKQEDVKTLLDAPIELTGKEFENSKLDLSVKENKAILRKEVQDYLKNMIGDKGIYIHNLALDKDVLLNNRSISEMLHYSGDPRKLNLMKHIKEIIATAKPENNEAQLLSNNKQDKKPNVQGYYHFINHVAIDGESKKLFVFFEVDDKGVLHYDFMIPKERAAFDSLGNCPTLTKRGIEPSAKAAYENHTATFDEAQEKYVLNLFIFDENGNEIKDEEDEDDSGSLKDETQEAPIELTGKEFGDFDTSTEQGKKALREKAFEYLNTLADNEETVFCPALNADVGFTKKSARKFKSLAGDPIKLQIAAQIKQIIAKGKKFKPSQEQYDETGRHNKMTYHYLKTAVKVAGVEHGARVVIREDINGNFHYDLQVKESVHAIMDSVNKNTAELLLATNQGLFSGAQGLNNLDGKNHTATFDEVQEKYVLNLFIFDENGNEIKDEEEVSGSLNSTKSISLTSDNELKIKEIERRADQLADEAEKVKEQYYAVLEKVQKLTIAYSQGKYGENKKSQSELEEIEKELNKLNPIENKLSKEYEEKKEKSRTWFEYADTLKNTGWYKVSWSKQEKKYIAEIEKELSALFANGTNPENIKENQEDKETPLDAPIELTGKEFGYSENMSIDELREKAIQHLETTMRNDWVDVPALKQVEETTKVQLRKRGFNHIKEHSPNPEKLLILSKIKQLLSTSKYLYSVDNVKTSKKPRVEKYHYLSKQFKFKGELFTCVIVIEKYQDGMLHYDILMDKYAQMHLNKAKEKTADNVSQERSLGDYQPSNQPESSGAFDNTAIFDEVQEKYVLNLFIFDENGNEIKDEEEDDSGSLNDEITQLITSANENTYQYLDYLDVSEQEIEDAKQHGLDIAGYKHVIDTNAVNHIKKQHGNEKTERERGQIAITDEDFKNLFDVISTPNKRIYGGKTSDGLDTIVSVKRLPDNSTVVVEEVRSGREKLAVKTMWKHTATTDTNSIIKNIEHSQSNVQNDSGRAVKNLTQDSEESNAHFIAVFNDFIDYVKNEDNTEYGEERARRIENVFSDHKQELGDLLNRQIFYTKYFITEEFSKKFTPQKTFDFIDKLNNKFSKQEKFISWGIGNYCRYKSEHKRTKIEQPEFNAGYEEELSYLMNTAEERRTKADEERLVKIRQEKEERERRFQEEKERKEREQYEKEKHWRKPMNDFLATLPKMKAVKAKGALTKNVEYSLPEEMGGYFEGTKAEFLIRSLNNGGWFMRNAKRRERIKNSWDEYEYGDFREVSNASELVYKETGQYLNMTITDKAFFEFLENNYQKDKE